MVSGQDADTVAFSSLNEAIDTGGAGGKLKFHVWTALSEIERSLIRERTRAGLTAALARGRNSGRPRSSSPDQAGNVKAMLMDPCMTTAEVARHFKMTLSKAMMDARYRVRVGQDSLGHHG